MRLIIRENPDSASEYIVNYIISMSLTMPILTAVTSLSLSPSLLQHHSYFPHLAAASHCFTPAWLSLSQLSLTSHLSQTPCHSSLSHS